MQQVKNFNNISDELKKTIPTLESGQVVTFQMLNGTPNNDPDLAERLKTPFFYPATQIRTVDRIQDPFTKKFVDIGVVDEWEGDRPVRYRFFVAGLTMSQFQGKFSLTGGSVEDEELFEYLYLSNYRADNSNRDVSVQPVFKLIDALKDSKDKEDTADTLFDALTLAKDIKEDDARELAKSLNWADIADFKILKAEIKNYAKENPKEFLAKIKDESKELKATIKTAVDLDIIKYDGATGKVTQGTAQLVTFDPTPELDLLTELASWFASAKNGDNVLEVVKKQIKAKQKKAAPQQ